LPRCSRKRGGEPQADDNEYLVDAYEYSTSIFEDVCQVADIFNEHQRHLLTRQYGGSKEAIDDYFLGVNEFQRRGERYLTGDNIHNHATEIINLTVCTENLNTGVVVMKSAQDGK
jgi:hypothetical protein